MELIKNITTRLNGSYISESQVYDEVNKKTYYVVVRLGNLLYATFDKSYIDYLKNKASKPKKIEGDDYLWFDSFSDKGETPFWSYYLTCLEKANSLENKTTINRKYSHLKKPLGNMKYEIISKKTVSEIACGPVGNSYQIKFHILDDDSYLYACANDSCFYSLCVGNAASDEPGDTIESFENFKNAKKSEYYDLFLEMEKYIDGVK